MRVRNWMAATLGDAVEDRFANRKGSVSHWKNNVAPMKTSRNKVRLGDTLFRSEHQIFEVVEANLADRNYLDWNVVALDGSTLSREHTLSGLADGYFILEATMVHGTGAIGKAYLDVSLPERIIDSHFLQLDGEVTRGGGTLLGDAQIIPAVAIEKFGVYDQYYVKGHAEIGLRVLRQGLDAAKLKWPIALDMAYILRDEKRFSEAIEAFTLAIQTGGGKSYFVYMERAKLLDKIGDAAAAETDWQRVEQMAGPALVKQERRF